jgi:hypothetical protein
MSDDHGEIDDSRGSAQSGLRRLMLKFPTQRTRLQKLLGSTSWPLLGELFEAYDEACVALEAFRHDDADRSFIEEYETVSAELEVDILRELDEAIFWPRDE